MKDEQIKKAFSDLKEVVKVSKILERSATYMKVSNFEFNGKTDNFLSYEDKRRLAELVEIVEDKLAQFKKALNESMDKNYYSDNR